MPVTQETPIGLPTALSRRLLSVLLGFGVAVALSAAPFLGAKRIPGFEPLVSLFPEEQRTILVVFSSFFIGLVALAIQFYAGERIARQSLLKGFGSILLIVAACGLVLLVLYLQFVRKVYNPHAGAYEVETIGWSRAAFCECPPTYSDAECIEGIAFRLESCWSESSITQVKLALFFTYLIAIEGFAVLAGLLVLQQDKIQKQKKETTKRRAKAPASRKAKPPE